MLKTLTSLSVLALVALSAPVLAQDSETTAPAAGQSDNADNPLDMGQPADTTPQLGQRYSKEKIGDWDLACVKSEGDKDPCSLLQVLHDPKTDNPMAEFSMFRIEGKGQAVAGATVIVPLETLLPAQLTISIDGAPGKRYNYSFCNPYGCVAQIGLTETDISAMKQGTTAILSLRPAPAPDQVVTLNLSLKGFTAGFDKVDVVKE
ncbi:invasion associated locus B family protein [Pseudodonghicola xiamenensis]|uniref:Invasion-associated locus B family protein n=1 Tax=Pseudodonghicola xiamenensis TaxID=337702 RepID=A0A8J3MBY2_9RHOB|nr:invasion associated locus B family protein [Pseudodonghicola xiamenensis]GHG81361.1 invasion-associated locus B family protein [Pseudodonghicola xiamenensis]